MAILNLALEDGDHDRVAAARQRLEKDFTEPRLLVIFLFQDVPEMQAAIQMIADGNIHSAQFFREHPYKRTLSAPFRDSPLSDFKWVPYMLSFLDDLIDAYKGGIPYMPPFAEGHKDWKTPEDRLVDDFEIIHAVLSACRSDKANEQVREAANHPLITANTWDAFAKRLANLQHGEWPQPLYGSVCRTILTAISELEKPRVLRYSGVSALGLAQLVHILDVEDQDEAFRRAFRILLSVMDFHLIRKALLSLERQNLERFSLCIWWMIHDTYERLWHEYHHYVFDAICELVGYRWHVVEEWYKGRWIAEDPRSWAAREYGQSYILE